MTWQLKTKIWLERDGKKVFGDGPCDILMRIERLGSLRKAAKEINMSYSQAWTLIKHLEQNLGCSLLEKKAGGTSGGYSSLTPEGARLTNAYYNFQQEARENLENIFASHFMGLENQDKLSQD